MIDLPDPRPDGRCCQCNWPFVVTTDGRFCHKCLTALIRQLNPNYPDERKTESGIMDGRFFFDCEDREAFQENAIRDLEEIGADETP